MSNSFLAIAPSLSRGCTPGNRGGSRTWFHGLRTVAGTGLIVMTFGCDLPVAPSEVNPPERPQMTSGVYRSYNGAMAAEYARANAFRAYGSGWDQNPWPTFDNKCTYFVSQSLIGGFLSTSSASTTYNRRTEFLADQGLAADWWFLDYNNRGSAFTGAHELYQYVRDQRPTYKGLHFQYVTHDTHTAFMDYNAVRVGDIIFMDWTGDGRIDHVNIVTAINYWTARGYDKIRVTGQSEPYTDRGLGEINEKYNYRALFTVYRPLDYNPNGL